MISSNSRPPPIRIWRRRVGSTLTVSASDASLGGRLGQLRIDPRRAEDLEVEERLGRRVDRRRSSTGPLRSMFIARRSGRLVDLLRARPGAVGVEADDRDLPEDARRARGDLEGVVDRAGGEVDRGVGLDRRVGVAAIGERPLRSRPSRSGRRPRRSGLRPEHLVRLRAAPPPRRRRQPREAVDLRPAVQRRRPLLDEDLDPDVPRADLLTRPARACASRNPLPR